jgi:hypothetical protein
MPSFPAPSSITPVPTSPNPFAATDRDLSIGGLIAAGTILGLWAISLILLLRADLTQWSMAQKWLGLHGFVCDGS